MSAGRRILAGAAIAAIVLAVGVLIASAILGPLPHEADAHDPTNPRAPVRLMTPVEELLTYEAGARGSTEPVYSQCDTHGHRVFASRHPIRFQVVNDPSCPGGGAR